MSTGLKTYDPIPKNRKIWQTVDGMNNRYMNVRETKSRLNTVYSEMDQDCCIQDQHRSNPFDMTNELGEHVRAESDDSNTSLREAIRRDLHQCKPNLIISLTQGLKFTQVPLILFVLTVLRRVNFATKVAVQGMDLLETQILTQVSQCLKPCIRR